MPRFDTKKRYVNKKGQKFGKGVWLSDTGSVLNPGESYDRDDTNKTITQYNTDGTKTIFTWEQWAKKNSKDNELRVLQNDRRYGIPVEQDKMMTISVDKNSPTRRNAGATFSENLLDSIAINAKRENVPFSTGLGIVSTESTFGTDERSFGHTPLPWLRHLNEGESSQKNKARNISYNDTYSPSLLISNWNQRNEDPFHHYFYNSQGQLRDTPRTAEFYEEDFNFSRNKNDRYQLEEISPLQHAFRQYKKDPTSYNPNDNAYPKKVEANIRELTQYSPEIKAYMQKYNLKAEGGSLNRSWDNLSLAEKSEMMKVAIKNGITDLSTIRQKYNEFAEGEEIPDDGEGIKTILNKVNSSKANFVSRLKDPNRKHIEDWASDSIATHKLGVATDEHGNHYIYPEVQEINGKLVDFTRPPYVPWAGQVTAEERGDTVRVPSIKEGVRFTENYKKYYPKGNTFSSGGDTDSDETTYSVGTGNFPEFTIEAQRTTTPYTYYDPWSRRYKGIGVGGQRIEYGEGFNPEGSILLPNAQAYENQRLIRAKQDDLNHAYDFGNKMRNAALLATVAPMAGPLVEAAQVVGDVAYPIVHSVLMNPYVDAGMTSVSAVHGLNHTINEGINDFGDATMTALDLLPFGIRAGVEAANTLNKMRKYTRLEKNFTGVPHKPLKESPSVYMDELFPKVHKQHTIWGTDDVDYARTFEGPDRTVFDIYTDPNELKVLDTPTPVEGEMYYWQGLPFKFGTNKVSLADNLHRERVGIPKTKEISLKGRGVNGLYNSDDLGIYVFKDNENSNIVNWKKANMPNAVSTDDVVSFGKKNGYNATRLHRIQDGAVEINGENYYYPINELILTPNAPRYVLPHGTPKYKVFDQLPNVFIQPQAPLGLFPFITNNYDERR